MTTKKTYHYLRTGSREHSVHGLTERQARQMIGYAIHDNGYGSKTEVQRFAASVTTDGTPATFGPYTFTLTEE